MASSAAYACQVCTKRKVRCSKTMPTCSNCLKSGIDCVYTEPPPRRRKRRLSGDISAKLAEYERILKHNGLFPLAETRDSTPLDTQNKPVALRSTQGATSQAGRLVTSTGSTRYVNSNLWDNIDDDEMQQASEEDDQEAVMSGMEDSVAAEDPFSLALMADHRTLLRYHPDHSQAVATWRTYLENVEPLCKVLHTPTVGKLIERGALDPSTVTKTEECLLFAIYHFAVLSMTEADCLKQCQQPRAVLLKRYHFCARQALVNAKFLKTTDMNIMQAYVLFLLSCRTHYDPSTYWILTGVAARISQRMGLHRDGEAAGLPPFEVQMRRRLFYQVVPLDGMSSRESGVSDASTPDHFDTLPPLNVNDDQIWPGMTTKPVSQKGATEMVFCLSRSYIGRAFAASKQLKDDDEAQKMISRTEDEVEDLYLRYCEFANPLHLLTNLATRSALNAMRLRVRLPRLNERPDTDDSRRERLRLSCKILDTDAAAHTHSTLRKYMWYIGPLFAWGTWDALISIVTALQRPDSLSRTETDDMWEKVEQLYSNHMDLMIKSKSALQVAIGRLALKAWDANPPSKQTPQPEFIVALRASRRFQYLAKRAMAGPVEGATFDEVSLKQQPSVLFDANATKPGDSPDLDFDFDYGNLLDDSAPDWVFWDNLIKDFQSQGAQN
ncbi:uncharacterized protein RHO25_006723 [Cercospora beticola]|uniref:Zn(2)-C6 fungal-type domain-containing protein n=2 Tax=Cercospora beticola TaxID=122368 RepID=A0ABZ0NRJ2_CERBT|nr:hypothetical protein RHO25_006723 [Cercospora beticola]